MREIYFIPIIIFIFLVIFMLYKKYRQIRYKKYTSKVREIPNVSLIIDNFVKRTWDSKVYLILLIPYYKKMYFKEMKSIPKKSIDYYNLIDNKDRTKFIKKFNVLCKIIKKKCKENKKSIFKSSKKITLKLVLNYAEDNIRNKYKDLIQYKKYKDIVEVMLVDNLMRNDLENKHLSIIIYSLNNQRTIRTRKQYSRYLRKYEKIQTGFNKKIKVIRMEKALLKSEKNKSVDVDKLKGHDFEEYVTKLFISMGYSATQTKKSGDQGIDVIASRNGVKYGIQTKRYSKPVSNKAVQEVISGLKFYDLDKGVVVTNNYFTKSAKELATKSNVLLIDRDYLYHIIETNIF